MAHRTEREIQSLRHQAEHGTHFKPHTASAMTGQCNFRILPKRRDSYSAGFRSRGSEFSHLTVQYLAFHTFERSYYPATKHVTLPVPFSILSLLGQTQGLTKLLCSLILHCMICIQWTLGSWHELGMEYLKFDHSFGTGPFQTSPFRTSQPKRTNAHRGLGYAVVFR